MIKISQLDKTFPLNLKFFPWKPSLSIIAIYDHFKIRLYS